MTVADTATRDTGRGTEVGSGSELEVRSGVRPRSGSARRTPPTEDAAFAAAIAREHARALRLAYLLTGHQQTAEDAVAEAIVRVVGPWRQGRVRELGPYLRTAVVNEVRNRRRRRDVERRERDRRRADHRGAAHATEQVLDRHVLVDALARLPQRQRLTVVLRYFEDLSVADTAATMGVSEGTVKSQTALAVATLRDHLDLDLASGGERS